MKISTKQEKLIACLVTEPTIEKACEKAGVTTVTYWRWAQQEAFKKEYRRARRTIFENTVARLQSLTHEAVDCLERNLHCENASVEIRAASIVLDLSARGIETLDLEGRIEMLEELQRDKEKAYERIEKQGK
jgi:hypothetical protein